MPIGAFIWYWEHRLPKIAQITITHKALPLVKTIASPKKKKKNPQQDHYSEWRFWFAYYPWSLFCNIWSEDSDLRILLSHLAVTPDLGSLFSFCFLPFDSTIVDCSGIIIYYFFVFVFVIWSCGYIGLRWFGVWYLVGWVFDGVCDSVRIGGYGVWVWGCVWVWVFSVWLGEVPFGVVFLSLFPS